MSDQRGIDVAFIYDSSLFTAEDQFSHFVMRRTATRDLFQVNFRTSKGRLLVGNHWLSRSGGDPRSAGYRAIAGETLAYFHQRIVEVQDKQTPVLAMGDFNDEPFDPSLVGYALAIRSRTKVMWVGIPVCLCILLQCRFFRTWASSWSMNAKSPVLTASSRPDRTARSERSWPPRRVQRSISFETVRNVIQAARDIEIRYNIAVCTKNVDDPEDKQILEDLNASRRRRLL